MTATGELRDQLIFVRRQAQRLLDALDDAVHDADLLDDAVIEGQQSLDTAAYHARVQDLRVERERL